MLSNSPVSNSRPHFGEVRKSEANAGKKWVDESSRAGEALLLCFELHNLVQRKRKMLKNIRNWQMLDVFQSLRTTKITIMLRGCQNKSGVCDGLQPVAWTVEMLRSTLEYVQFISKVVLARLNWILFPQYLHSHNIFGENLRKVVPTSRRDVESSESKHHRPQGVKKCFPPEIKNHPRRPRGS